VARQNLAAESVLPSNELYLAKELAKDVPKLEL
jgi:hypothetical protein